MSGISCLEKQTSQNDSRMFKMSKIQDAHSWPAEYIERKFNIGHNPSCLPESVDFMELFIQTYLQSFYYPAGTLLGIKIGWVQTLLA